MKNLTVALVFAVFTGCCVLARSMLTLMLEVRNAGRVLPYFTNLCISLRPVLIMLPLLGTAYCVWVWFHQERGSKWPGFVLAAMVVLVCFVLPAISSSYLVMIDQVRAATGAR